MSNHSSNLKMGNSNFEHTPQTKFPHGTTASQKATVRAFDKFYRYEYKRLSLSGFQNS